MYEGCHYVNRVGQLDGEGLSLGAALCVNGLDKRHSG